MFLDYDRYTSIGYVLGGREYPYLDCWGFVVDVYKQNGINLNLHTELKGTEIKEGYTQDVNDFIQIEKPIENCIVGLFAHGIIFHCGIYHNGKFCHMDKQGLQIESFERYFMKKRCEVRYYVIKRRGCS